MKIMRSIIFYVVSAILAIGFDQSMANAKEINWLSWNIGRASLAVSGTYRIRGEWQDEFHVKNFGTGETEDFLLCRLRLETDVRFSQQARLHLQLQDARAFGLSFSDQDFAAGNNPFHSRSPGHQSGIF